MIKSVKISGRPLVLYEGSQEEIDYDIFRILDWYADYYGIDAMYDMLLAHSHKKIKEARRVLSAEKSKQFVSAYTNHNEETKESE